MHTFFKHHLPIILWCLLVFTLSSIPNLKIDGPEGMDFILRKAAHVFEYLVLFILSCRSTSHVFQNKKTVIISAAIFTLAYAISDEIHQSYVPNRAGAYTDVLIDSLGIIIGIGLKKR